MTTKRADALEEKLDLKIEQLKPEATHLNTGADHLGVADHQQAHSTGVHDDQADEATVESNFEGVIVKASPRTISDRLGSAEIMVVGGLKGTGKLLGPIVKIETERKELLVDEMDDSKPSLLIF